eukprot:TRINITY_DN94619_c0_g1_i1.p1 TRINITY_DN94619_c0_g1~~TRINITY_DN94619_c0_g1_i1.p1  ORF type:complete len:337 (+),score=52.60 TRINITY_DN94619_c0_g1_i1:35-1045(+)
MTSETETVTSWLSRVLAAGPAPQPPPTVAATCTFATQLFAPPGHTRAHAHAQEGHPFVHASAMPLPAHPSGGTTGTPISIMDLLRVVKGNPSTNQVNAYGIAADVAADPALVAAQVMSPSGGGSSTGATTAQSLLLATPERCPELLLPAPTLTPSPQGHTRSPAPAAAHPEFWDAVRSLQFDALAPARPSGETGLGSTTQQGACPAKTNCDGFACSCHSEAARLRAQVAALERGEADFALRLQEQEKVLREEFHTQIRTLLHCHEAEIMELNREVVLLQRSVADQYPKCVICLEGPATVLLLPCRHQAMCDYCSLRQQKCPLCRGHVRDRIRPFTP